MNEKEIEINLNIEQLRLTSLSVKENIDNEDSSRINKVELIDFNQEDSIIELKYTEEFIHNVKINLELIALLKIEGEISQDDFTNVLNSEKAEELAFPLLNEASHIIAFITSKTEMLPMILPPLFRRLDDTSEENED